MGERGSVLPVTVVVVLAATVSIAVLVGLSKRAIDAAEAQAAADMAALAAVFEGRSGAEDLAARNGAQLVDYRVVGEQVRVVVRSGSALAEAAAVYDDGTYWQGSSQPGG